MKKVLSVILAVIMVFSTCSLFAFAKEEEVVPVIVLQGYSGPTLVYTDENGEPIIDSETGDVVKAWHLDLGELILELVAALPAGIVGTAMGYDAIAEAWSKILKDALAPIGVNPDGSSRENLTYYPKGAAATQISALIENDMEEYIPESVFCETAIEMVGAENVFGFTYDWRKSQVDYAKAIDEYIQEVKGITGSDKVDLMGLSHGGQYGTSYLYYYGHKHDVRNAILANPATFGTTVVGQLFTGKTLDLDMQNLMKWIQYAFDMEEDFDLIFKYLTLEDLIALLNRVLSDEELVMKAAHMPSLLDFIPNDYFEEAVEFTGLSAKENGKAYYDTVEFHTNLAAGDNLSKKLAQLREEGMKIGHIVGVGYESVSGQNYNGDLVIDAHLSSGSYCTPLGETLPADYVQQNINCDNPNHYHISPEYNLDASTGFSPDHTWYAIGQAHGQYFNDPYTRQIVCEYLWGELETVFDDERFPQFNYTQKHADNIYVHFDNTDVGYHSSADTELIIENLSNTSPIHILCVDVNGVDMDYNFEINTVLQVGEKYVIDVNNVSPETADKPFKVAVTYIIDNTQHTIATKEFSFIAMSDENMEIYSHLVKKTVNEEVLPAPEETVKPEETTESTETEISTEKPVVDETTTEENKEIITDVEIPDTDSFQPKSVVIALAVCGVALTTSVVMLKKKED
ncbi:MAG: hypothetical protein IJZ16_08260 [Clostridia bacterium]|nr:hypothetical protein [Clostridia bacterium]